ncbi:MAG: hypothetical protein K6E33_06290 [Lachnospiraceae bacterium]|nr:hypothetical protein [Lachnospiraceae bacterium]
MQYNIKTIDKNGNITSENEGAHRDENGDKRPFRKRPKGNNRQNAERSGNNGGGNNSSGGNGGNNGGEGSRNNRNGENNRNNNGAGNSGNNGNQGRDGSNRPGNQNRNNGPQNRDSANKAGLRNRNNGGQNHDAQNKTGNRNRNSNPGAQDNANRPADHSRNEGKNPQPQNRRDNKGVNKNENRNRKQDADTGNEPEKLKENGEARSEKSEKSQGNGQGKSRRNNQPNRQKRQGAHKGKDIYDKDTRVWVQYQHYGTDDLSATVTFSKNGEYYVMTKVTVTSVGGKLMDLWHVPTYTEDLVLLADSVEFSDLLVKLRASKKMHRDMAPAVDEPFVCVCDNENDLVMFPGGCPENDELSAEAERFVNDLGLKVARLCNPQEAMKNYGYL